MNDAEVLKMIQTGELDWPFETEMEELESLERRGLLMAEEMQRLNELRSAKPEFDQHAAAYKVAVEGGNDAAMQKHSEAAAKIVERLRGE